MLPDINGLDILRKVRLELEVPILIHSAQDGEADRVAGLELGADDYISKPFSPRELLARLPAVARRIHTAVPCDSGADCLNLRELTLNLSSMEASLHGRVLALSPFEFRLLTEMMRQPGRIFTREQLMDYVGERDLGVFDRSIDMHIYAIRSKLGDNPRCPQYLKTIRGSGPGDQSGPRHPKTSL